MIREDIEQLYKVHGCPNICPYALEDIPINVMKKTIAKSIYRSKVVFEMKDRRATMHSIASLLDMNIRTLENYFPPNKDSQKEAFKH